MRRKILVILMLGLFSLIVFSIIPSDYSFSRDVYKYYVENFLEETGAANGVTALYLNYRVFDTIFEALLLLVSIIGIIHFSMHEGAEHE